MSEQANQEQLILAIETATRTGSVAVMRGDKVLSSQEGDPSISHSTNLIEMVEEVLHQSRARLLDIDVFAVAVGPGSFTGLRIGLATVKAFAESNARRIVGISTLAAVAHASGYEGLVVSLLPAGRGEVFAQLFSVGDGMVEEQDVAAHLSPAETFARYGYTPDLHWTGEGITKLSGYLGNVSPGPAQLASSFAALALRGIPDGKRGAPEKLGPVYVRPSDAEINERWQQQKQKSQAQVEP